jgi:iron(III) transport system substrate-binding protein
MKQKRAGVVLSLMLPVLAVLFATEASPQAWKSEWEKTLAAAKKEGKLVVAGPPGQTYRDALVAFQKTHPEIQVDYVGTQGRDFAQRIMQERRAGQYLWDLNMGGGATMFSTFIPAKVLDPLRPALIMPDLVQDKTWRSGFDDGWVDLGKRYIYGFVSYVQFAVHVNRDVVAASEFNKAGDLWDPKWKGKIVMHDPRREGIGTHQGTVILLNFGEDALRRFFKDQAPVITEDYRQVAEWIARERYPIAVGVNLPNLTAFQKEGVGKNVVAIEDPKFLSAIAGFGNVALINQAAHPNAAKVYLNWLLSKEGQSIFARLTGQNSRRLDAETGDKEYLPKPGVTYLNGQKQEHQEVRLKVNQIAKEIFK